MKAPKIKGYAGGGEIPKFKSKAEFDKYYSGLGYQKNPYGGDSYYNPGQYGYEQKSDKWNVVSGGGGNLNTLGGNRPDSSHFYEYTAPKQDLITTSKTVVEDSGRKPLFTGNANYQSFQYPDQNAGYSQATTKHFDKTTGKEIDLSKSFTPDGKYLATPYKLGGLVKGYKWGGTTTVADGEETTTGIGGGTMDPAAKSGIGVASQLGSLGGSYLSSKAMNEDGTVNAKQTALGGALSGGAKGAQMGMMFGPQGAAIGALAGAGIGGTMKYLGAKNLNEDIADGQEKAAQDKIREQQQITFSQALNNQMMERQAGMNKGGVVKGAGTGTSDSINAKVEAGSFVVPAVNKTEALAVKKLVLKAPSTKKKANLNQAGGVEIKVSNNEVIFTPEEKQEIIDNKGVDYLQSLAPDAKTKLREHLNCGGMVKGYAAGGDVDGEDPLKKEKERLAQEKLANEKEGKYYKDLENLTEVNLKKLEARKKAEKDFKYWKDALDAAKKDYSKYQEDLKKDPMQKSGIRDLPKSNKEALDRKEKGRKEQEERLNNITRIENSYNKAGKKYTDAKDDKNFNPDGSFKESSVKAPSTKTTVKLPEKNIYSTSGANVHKVYDNDFAKSKGASGTGTKKAPKIGDSYVNSFKPTLTDDSDVVPPPMEIAKKKEQTGKDERYERDLAAAEAEGLANMSNQNNKNNLLSQGLKLGASQLGSLGNYFLPYQQYKMGQKFLAQAGDRPVDKIDPDFQNAVNKAQVNATYGYTPEEQAILDGKNLNALRAGQNAAKNFSGGSSANAINLTRQASNDYYTRGLSSLASGKNLQQNKQQYADELTMARADKSRQLFNDNMNTWQQNTGAASSLIGMGLQNLIGANRFSKEQQFQNQLNDNSNPYKNFGNNGLTI